MILSRIILSFTPRVLSGYRRWVGDYGTLPL